MVVPEEYASQIRKISPKEPTKTLIRVLKKGLSRIRAEANWQRTHPKVQK